MQVRSALCMAAGLSLAMAGRSSAVILQNGSFETVSGTVATAPGVFTAAAGWSINANGGPNGPDNVPNICYAGTQGYTNGSNAAVFDSDGASGVGTLYQTFSTTPGTTYSATFDYGQFGYPHQVANKLIVDMRPGASPTVGQHLIAPGATADVDPFKFGNLYFDQSDGTLTIYDSASSNNASYTTVAPNAEFSHFTFRFTATSALSTISFLDGSGDAVPSNDGMLDNVAVTAVPEPAALGAIGVLSTLLRRRR